MDTRSHTSFLSTVLFWVAALVGLTLFAAALETFWVPGDAPILIRLLALPGGFAFDAFHIVSFYIPGFLVYQGFLARRDRVSWNEGLSSLVSIFPALSFALVARIFFTANYELSPLIRWSIQTFTIEGTLMIWSLFGVFTGLISFRLGRSVERVPETKVEIDTPHQTTGDLRKDPWFFPENSTTDEVVETKEPETETILEVAGDAEPESFVSVESEIIGEPEMMPEVAPVPEVADDEVEVFFSRGRLTTVEPEVAIELEAEEFEEPEIEFDLALEPEVIEETLLDEPIIDEPVNDDPVDETILPPPEPPRYQGTYDVPIRGILDIFENEHHWQIDQTATDAAEVLRTTLQEFGIQAEVTGIRKGPVITMFEILPAPGVKLTRIVNLADNIALRLAAESVRIVAPIPGKHAVGIEIPNKNRHLVGFAELLQDPLFHDPKHEIPVALGKDITGDAQIVDLARTPHLLIAGATGSGKSVCVNSLICSVLYRRSPEEVKMILIDPKIVELKFYNDIPHLLTPVITDPKKAFQALQWCIYEMERRYSLLDAMAVRDIRSYNKKIKVKQIATTSLPYIVVVIDEFADLMATTGKELESTLARLAAMSRAVGIHLVLATQRPSTDVITGLIKANIPSRIAFMVASKIDSRIILDAMGAEKLLGKGDMLFTSAWNPFPTRMQGAFLSEEEVERIVAHVRQMGKPDYIDDEIFIEDDDEGFYQEDLEDPLMDKAIEIVVSAGKASASYLQRRLKIGYNRAARMVEMLEGMGIVGPQNGSKAREVLRNPEAVR